jgi:hypothetical protein
MSVAVTAFATDKPGSTVCESITFAILSRASARAAG